MRVSQVALSLSEEESECPMSKPLAIVATLKGILIAASVAFARGDMMPVILISVLFNLAQLGAKPGGRRWRETPSWCRRAMMRAANFEITRK